MKKEYKIGLLIVSVIISAIISLLLLMNGLFEFFLLVGIITLVILFVLIIYLKNNRSPEEIFKSNLNNILKTYDGILISSNNIPKLEGKNIILIDTIEDLIDAQAEIRKPIYYKKTISSCSFILLDNNEACIYTLKLDDKTQAPIDLILDEIKQKEQKQAECSDEKVLEQIEKTTIVKLGNNKSYKISPMKKKKEEIEIL